MGLFSNIFGNRNNQSETNMVDANNINPKFDDFNKLSNDDEDALRKSVIQQYFKEPNEPESYNSIGYNSTGTYTDFVYGMVATSKTTRLKNYRMMSEFPEISDAIDEICDTTVNFDENNRIVNLAINDKTISNVKEKELQEEFDNFISLFDLESNFFEFSRTLIIDGQLAWENIIDEENTESGIIGINYIPAESYEFMVDENSIKKGIMVTTKESVQKTSDVAVQGNIQVQGISEYNKEKSKDANSDEDQISIEEPQGVPLPWEQVTYIDTGVYNPNKMIVYPVLERARKAYRQLSLIEDSILIYRLVRSPVRYVFNVDTGKLPRSKAEEEVNKLMNRYQTKKFYNPVTGSTTNDYDPHQMMENFWFPRPEGSGGTEVSTLDGGVNWTELPDLEYFQRKLFMSLKVPFNRLNEPTVNIERGDSISADEYRFCKFVMRIQERFAKGLTHSFITHLKLIGLWEQYQLCERDIRIKITAPTSFELYEQQRLLKIKFDNYNTAVENREEMSKEIAMKKYLDWTEDDVKANRENVEREILSKAALDRKAAIIGSSGNPYKTEAGEGL